MAGGAWLGQERPGGAWLARRGAVRVGKVGHGKAGAAGPGGAGRGRAGRGAARLAWAKPTKLEVVPHRYDHNSVSANDTQ